MKYPGLFNYFRKYSRKYLVICFRLLYICENKNENMAFKQSADQYRNIKGVRYEMYTANAGEFNEAKQWAKTMNLKYRIIGGQLYVECRNK